MSAPSNALLKSYGLRFVTVWNQPELGKKVTVRYGLPLGTGTNRNYPGTTTGTGTGGFPMNGSVNPSRVSGGMEKKLSDDGELSSLKLIDLPGYAISLGFTVDSRESSGRWLVLRKDGDKLLAGMTDGRWCYRNERDSRDKGSVIDFAMHQHGIGLGDARKLLRAWEGNETSQSFLHSAPIAPPDSEPDREGIAAVWESATRTTAHDYLVRRCVPVAVQSDPRFADCWRASGEMLLFPHTDALGLCGYERRGQGFKGFSKGGKRALWRSGNVLECKRLVVCESPIDALAYQALHGGDAADSLYPLGYVATGGTIGSGQRRLLGDLLGEAVKRGASIIAGQDSDTAGHAMTDIVRELCPACERHEPVGKDWADDLMRCNKENS